MKKGINLEETILIGKWIESNNEVISDETCKRINYLINNHLKKIITDETGWETLYRDPNDDRLWLLTYPQGHLQGGGPPQLKVINKELAQKKFGYS